MEDSMIKEIADKYDRIAGLYDAVDWFIPSRWRRQAAAMVCGRVLEVGVGTGLNLPYYTDRCSGVLGIDISTGMLAKARERIPLCRVPVQLEVMDIQDLPLDSVSFDCVLAAFVFCTVPDPAAGLRECHRVLKPGGRLILLEHTGSESKLLRPLMDSLNPLAVRLMGDHINRDTAKEAVNAGFNVTGEKHFLGDIVRLIGAIR